MASGVVAAAVAHATDDPETCTAAVSIGVKLFETCASQMWSADAVVGMPALYAGDKQIGGHSVQEAAPQQLPRRERP